MIKRLFDIIVSFCGLLIASPFLIIVGYLIYRQDNHSPFYIATRIGLNQIPFRMYKFRSMIINADKNNVMSTKADDNRITPIGHFVRRYKFDELPQLWNVLIGEMSLVGPRPNVKSEVDLYTPEELHLLDVKPGVTDFASLVFSDEGDILKGSNDPDLAYNQLIRPWKSELGVLYARNHNLWTDVQLIVLTVVSILSKSHSRRGVQKILIKINAPSHLVGIAIRDSNTPLTYPFDLDYIPKK